MWSHCPLKGFLLLKCLLLRLIKYLQLRSPLSEVVCHFNQGPQGLFLISHFFGVKRVYVGRSGKEWNVKFLPMTPLAERKFLNFFVQHESHGELIWVGASKEEVKNKKRKKNSLHPCWSYSHWKMGTKSHCWLPYFLKHNYWSFHLDHAFWYLLSEWGLNKAHSIWACSKWKLPWLCHALFHSLVFGHVPSI